MVGHWAGSCANAQPEEQDPTFEIAYDFAPDGTFTGTRATKPISGSYSPQGAQGVLVKVDGEGDDAGLMHRWVVRGVRMRWTYDVTTVQGEVKTVVCSIFEAGSSQAAGDSPSPTAPSAEATRSGSPTTLIGHTWQPEDITKCSTPFGLAYMEYGEGIVNLTFAFTGAGEMIKTYQYSPPNPNEQPSVFTYTLSGGTLKLRTNMGVQSYRVDMKKFPGYAVVNGCRLVPLD